MGSGLILVGIPSNRKWIRSETAHRFMTLALTSKRIGGFVIIDRVPHDVARSNLAKYFLEKTKCDWLLSCDDDVIPPENILDMVDDAEKNNRLLVSTNVNQLRDGKAMPVCFKMTGNEFTRCTYRAGVASKVDAFGTGCYIAKREVFETVPSPWYAFIKQKDGMDLKAGEDIVFTYSAKMHGIQPYWDARFKAGHVKEQVI